MIKKLIPFVFCMAPLTAMGATCFGNNCYEPVAGNVSLGGIDAGGVANDSYYITGGRGLTVGSGGITLAGDMYFGRDYSDSLNTGNLYISADAESPYLIISEGDVAITGALDVVAGSNLTLRGGASAIDMDIGSIANNGTLSIFNADNLTAGAITTDGDLSIDADALTAGAITNDGGTTIIETVHDITTDGIHNNSTGTTTIASTEAAIIISGDVENSDGAGIMNISAGEDIPSGFGGGYIEILGNLENSGTQMNIYAQDYVHVAGTLKNDSNSVMVINTNNIDILGGDATNASLVNKGDLIMTVTGAVQVDYGFDLVTMGADNVFSLTAGYLKGNTQSNWYTWLTNNSTGKDIGGEKYAGFNLNLTDGDLIAAKMLCHPSDTACQDAVADFVIKNGTGNANANMNITARSVQVESVLNSGDTLNITSTDAAGELLVTGTVTNGAVGGNANSVTNLISANELTVVGGVANNNGTMTLNGKTVDLGSVINKGGTLNVLGATDASGSVDIYSAKTEDGTLNINARQVDIANALINAGGTINIDGSDSGNGAITIGNLSAFDGDINIGSKIGSVYVDGTINVGAAGALVDIDDPLAGTYDNGGALNFATNVHNVTANDTISIDGDLTVSDTAATGDGNVNVVGTGTGGLIMKSETGNINIVGDITGTAGTAARLLTLSAATGEIDVVGNVTATGDLGSQIFTTIRFGEIGSTAGSVDIAGDVVSNAGGVIEFNVGDVNLKSLSGAGKFVARGDFIEATGTGNAINIQNGIWYDGSNPNIGFVITDTNELTLSTLDSGANIAVAGGISMGVAGDPLNDPTQTLNLISQNQVNVSGLVNVNETGILKITSTDSTNFTNTITNAGDITVTAASITGADIKNTGTLAMTSTGAMSLGTITNGDAAEIITGGAINLTATTITATAISATATAGIFDLYADSLNVGQMNLAGGKTNLNTTDVTVNGNVKITGDVNQGGVNGVLNLTQDNTVFNVDGALATDIFKITGDLIATDLSATYNIKNSLQIAGVIKTIAGADVTINAADILTGGIDNGGDLLLTASLTDLGNVRNSGTMTINNEDVLMKTFTTTDGWVKIYGDTLTVTDGINISGNMRYNSSATLSGGDVNFTGTDYIVSANDIYVGGNINAAGLTLTGDGTNGLNLDVGGNVYGGLNLLGLESMHVDGSYTFDNNSILGAKIIDGKDYWGEINDAGTISGSSAALITVDKTFTSNITTLGGTGATLEGGQIGITISSMVDQGDTIWLIDALEGIEELGMQTRNVTVKFCDMFGENCFDYYGDVEGAYLTMRDSNGDGIADQVYIVFDPKHGGPIEIYKIQPPVGGEATSTTGEYETAGALDDLVAQVIQNRYGNARVTIEAIPIVLDDTNLAQVGEELRDRMEQYNLDHDGTQLANFSRLFQPRELEMITGSILANEHTTFRDMEARMVDEFIWNRNRHLKKAWLDFDFGTMSQNGSDDTDISMDRFGIAGGFDWKHSETLLVGLTAHMSYTSGSVSDEMDLTYGSLTPLMGRVDVDVSNLNFGFGGYMMQTLNEKMRVYGNAFMDLSFLDVDRTQNYVAPINGSGMALSVITEWGLLHDWLNQYIVGNLYARGGYNFGFSIKTEAAGGDYMDLESDGYLILTPGYSITAQKRIYPSAWFQIRPHATIGVEYDLLGTPDDAQFKFAVSSQFTDYSIEIDPLWMYAGAGFEFLGANGVQIGIDYRYQHNADIQMHKFRLSGSYRF